MESSVHEVSELRDLVLPVSVIDFSALAGASDVYVNTNAAYRKSTHEVLINNSFFQLTSLEQHGVLAHEVAHAVDHRNDLLTQLPEKFKISIQPEEFLADRIASSWGLFDAVREMRKGWGQEYLDALALWENESEYYRAMSKWNLRRSAGII
jgi:hypothetical protein